jgi:hypothetical protein
MKIKDFFFKFASCCMHTINIYKFYHQHNNYFLVDIALHVLTSTGRPHVLQVSHIQLLKTMRQYTV